MLKGVKGKRLFAMALIFNFLFSSVVFFADSSNVHAFTAANAETAMEDFLNVFYDPVKKYFYTNSDRQIHEHAAGPENGLYTDYWWEAQIWQTIMDAYERTNDPKYLNLIHDIYDGFNSAYPNWESNPFNDDIAWWALGSIRAYEITGDTRYKTRAKEMFDHIWQSWSSDFGGGIWWNTINFLPQKNVATNATAAIIAVRLYNAYNDPSYLSKAHDLYNWLENTLYAGNGYVYDQYRQGEGLIDWEFTYNFGGFAGASLELYKVTGNSRYLTNATDCVDWVFNNMTVDGTTLLYEGIDDVPAFKMIFMRNVKRLVYEANQTQYLKFLQDNATQAWNHRRTSDGIIGPDWSLTPDSGYIQSIAAAAGVDILFLSDPDNFTGVVVGSGTYEAENARRFNVPVEDNDYERPGYSGRSYVAGWNQNGSSVLFPVNVQSNGTYAITFRYSAAAGNAVRKLTVNGVSMGNVAFTQTSSWSDWSSVSVYVPLIQGTNKVELIFDSSSGSTNYLNLDKITVAEASGRIYEAESAVLHNLSTESTYGDYSGSGYIAGWNSNGQWVDFNVNVDTAGYYNLIFRYAAGAGNASRYLYVNGTGVVDNQAFSATGSWSNYSTVTVSNVYLHSGSNTISLIFNSSKGSTNWLNLDYLQVVQ